MDVDVYSVLDFFLTDKATTTCETYLQVFRLFLQFLDGRCPYLIEICDIWAFHSYLKKRKGIKARADNSDDFSRRTIIKYFSILRAIYKYFVSVKLVKNNHFDRPEFHFKERKVSEKRPTEAVQFSLVKKIVKAPKGTLKQDIRNRAMLTTFFAAGIRRNDLRCLRLHDVRWTDTGLLWLKLRATKGGGDKIQPMPEWSHDAIRKLYDQRILESATPQDFLFTGYTRDQRTQNGQMDPKTIWTLFRRFSGHSPHDARATGITRLLQMGFTYRQVQEFSGHGSVAMIERYDKTRIDTESHIGKKLNFD